MSDEFNPYQSPAAESSAAAGSPLQFFVVGAVLGCVSFIAAIALIPGDVPSPSMENLLLANYLGFWFPILVGLWSGWIRHSCRWAAGGVAIGFAIGACYYLLCGYKLLAVMVACPCLLGGLTCAAFGSGADSWFDGLLARLGKGLLAGCVCGLVALVALNVLGISWFQVHCTAGCDWLMWHDGPVAMGAASGLYLVLFVWASNLGVLPLKL